jgi:hypothetical protein
MCQWKHVVRRCQASGICISCLWPCTKGGTMFFSGNDAKADCWSYRRGDWRNYSPKWVSHDLVTVSGSWFPNNARYEAFALLGYYTSYVGSLHIYWGRLSVSSSRVKQSKKNDSLTATNIRCVYQKSKDLNYTMVKPEIS